MKSNVRKLGKQGLALILAAAACYAPSSFASGAAMSTTAEMVAPESAKPWVWNGKLTVETTRNVNVGEYEAPSYGGFYELVTSVAHKQSNTSAKLTIGYSREYSYERDDGTVGSFEYPALAIAKSFKNNSDFNADWIDSVSLALSGTTGVNNESRRRSLLWTNGVSVTGLKKLGQVSVSQGFGYSRSFYESEIRDNGVVNSPNSYKSTTSLSLDFNDKFSIGMSYLYAYAVSFQDVAKAVQTTTFSADYAITDKISTSIGVQTERGTLEPDGQTNRVRFFAPEAAQYFFDLVVAI